MKHIFVHTLRSVVLIGVSALTMLSACAGSDSSRSGDSTVITKAVTPSTQPTWFAEIAPVYGDRFVQGDRVAIGYTLSQDCTVDSVILAVNNRRIGPIASSGFTYNLGPTYQWDERCID